MKTALKHIRRLTLFLMISGAINIILGALFIYIMVKDQPSTLYYDLKPADREQEKSPIATNHSNSEVIRCFRRMPCEWLFTRLKNTQLVENGYTQRDLAIASLITFHHFDLERALSGLPMPEQKRTVVYGKYRDGTSAELILYPGLTEQHFEAIYNFATKERWPLTCKGLFLALQKEIGEKEPSLLDSFFITPDFLIVETLLGRSDVTIDKREILEVILQGDWKMLFSFVEQQKVAQDLSSARRQSFLLDYIHCNSKAAAKLLLKTDFDFAARKLNDIDAIKLLQLFDEKNTESEKYALTLLTSPRSDDVWKMAAARLYEYAGEILPEKYNHHQTLARFVPQHTIVSFADTQSPFDLGVSESKFKQTEVVKPSSGKLITTSLPRKSSLPISKKERLYIVQEKDSLWKISRRFNIEVSSLKSYNKLESDFLKPGMHLRIP